MQAAKFNPLTAYH